MVITSPEPHAWTYVPEIIRPTHVAPRPTNRVANRVIVNTNRVAVR